jgi:hypothetical protein
MPHVTDDEINEAVQRQLDAVRHRDRYLTRPATTRWSDVPSMFPIRNMAGASPPWIASNTGVIAQANIPIILAWTFGRLMPTAARRADATLTPIGAVDLN